MRRASERFDKFSSPAVIAQGKRVSGELLCDRAGPFLYISGVEIADRRPGNSRKIDAVVFVEPRVLPRQQSFDEIRRDLCQGHHVTNFSLEPAVAHAGVIEDLGNRGNSIQFSEIEAVSNLPVFPIPRISEKERSDSQPDAEQAPGIRSGV